MLVMCSLPATITLSASPRRMAWPARISAFMDDRHACWTVCAGTDAGIPPPIAISLPGFGPFAAWRALPTIVSSNSLGSRPDLSRAAAMAAPPIPTASVPAKAPPNLPMGVRAVATITTSRLVSVTSVSSSRYRSSS